MNKLNKKGFTLIEMLVVIAIIAVLVSIIIPTVSSATDKAKGATDAANLRSALAEIQIKVLDGDIEATTAWTKASECSDLSASVKAMESKYSSTSTSKYILYYQVSSADNSVKVGFSADGTTVNELAYYQKIAETGKPS